MKIWTKSTKKIINSYRRSVLGVHWKDWCWSWNSNTLATWCEELTHLKRPWCWERLRAGGEGDDGSWDGWMASPTQWTWVWVGSRSWWWTGQSGVLQFMGSQRVGHNWATELEEPIRYGRRQGQTTALMIGETDRQTNIGNKNSSENTCRGGSCLWNQSQDRNPKQWLTNCQELSAAILKSKSLDGSTSLAAWW